MHYASALKSSLLLTQRQALNHVEVGSLRVLHFCCVASTCRVGHGHYLVFSLLSLVMASAFVESTWLDLTCKVYEHVSLAVQIGDR